MTKQYKKTAALPHGVESPWRDRPVEESLRIFEDMRCGYWDEKAAVLRMRGDLRSDISSMWDLTAYRVKKAAHPRTGTSWCIYPTYDFSHCIVDSLEKMTHSFCDINYIDRQSPNGPYYWLLDKLGLYKPVTWEFGRCSLTYNVTSKRKLNALVTGGHVCGWDDPRLLTIAGLRRRGYTASSINRFCSEIGTTRKDRCLPYHKLEALIRSELADIAPRKLCVLDPLRVEIVNHPGDALHVELPNHPSFPEMGSRSLKFGATVFIERNDFMETDKEGFYGLAPGKTVRLYLAWDITCIGFDVDASGKVSCLRCSMDLESHESMAPKGKLHWASDDAKRATVRLYERLFKVEKPGAKEKKEQARTLRWRQ
jgi:glutaminyl-tRNA synthetase